MFGLFISWAPDMVYYVLDIYRIRTLGPTFSIPKKSATTSFYLVKHIWAFVEIFELYK